MSKHTPGPWAVVGEGTIKSGDLSIGEAYIYDENDYDYNPKSDDVRKKLPWMANARLMAAAPEMKQKLDEMTEFLRIVYACIPEEIAGTCARQVTNWEMLKAKIEGDE